MLESKKNIKLYHQIMQLTHFCTVNVNYELTLTVINDLLKDADNAPSFIQNILKKFSQTQTSINVINSKYYQKLQFQDLYTLAYFRLHPEYKSKVLNINMDFTHPQNIITNIQKNINIPEEQYRIVLPKLTTYFKNYCQKYNINLNTKNFIQIKSRNNYLPLIAVCVKNKEFNTLFNPKMLNDETFENFLIQLDEFIFNNSYEDDVIDFEKLNIVKFLKFIQKQ